jgi:hypothetical protein
MTKCVFWRHTQRSRRRRSLLFYPKKGHSKDLREFFRFSGFVCSLFYFVFLSVGFFFSLFLVVFFSLCECVLKGLDDLWLPILCKDKPTKKKSRKQVFVNSANEVKQEVAIYYGM